MKDVKGYEGLYSITSDGRVYSHLSKKFLKPLHNGTGYSVVYLFKEDTRRTCLIHRLVAEAYIPNPENKPNINHKDSDRKNNKAYNLEWCTPAENTLHATLYGGKKDQGSKSKMAKLTEDEVISIRKEYEETSPMKKTLALKYNVSPGLISQIVNRRIWRHI